LEDVFALAHGARRRGHAAHGVRQRKLRFLRQDACRAPKSCVRAGSAAWDYANGDLGEVVGQIYVQQTFGAEGKERTLAMVGDLEKALGEDIKSVPWMGADTKRRRW
jgi:predicted metalloendopeptidase